jgi:hypothetical protein
LHAPAHGGFIERLEHRTLEVHAFRNRNAGAAPGDGQGTGVVRIPDLFLVAAPQFDFVAVAFGDEQAGRRAVHLDHRVVGGGGAVHEDVQVAAERRKLDVEALGELLQPAHDAARLVVERGRRLVEHDLAARCHTKKVGERATDVHPNPVAHCVYRREARSASVAASSTASVRSSSEPVSTTP